MRPVRIVHVGGPDFATRILAHNSKLPRDPKSVQISELTTQAAAICAPLSQSFFAETQRGRERWTAEAFDAEKSWLENSNFRSLNTAQICKPMRNRDSLDDAKCTA